LIGRSEDFKAVTARLANTRLLTLSGVGGCGKTRLALEVARAEVEHYADGVWLIELGPIADSALVALRVAAVLGVLETADEQITTTLARVVCQRNVLLVLDNCEHLLDACAQLIDVLLGNCPYLRVLATSREPIGIGGEVAWRVPSLKVPDADAAATPAQLLLNPAVQLFTERAAAVQPRFELTVHNVSAVVQVCRSLDGIPLALELAAARLEALSAEQVAQRLDQRFRLLSRGSRAVLPRQQTLTETFNWSYDLLTRPERRLFERLAVFSGGWTLDAAEGVCAGGGLHSEDVVDVLTQLTRKSLVVADQAVKGFERYSFLETVREYAHHKLVARGDTAINALRDRHAAFYESLVHRLLPDPHAVWSIAGNGPDSDFLGRFGAEYDNLRLALDWWLESEQPAPAFAVAARLRGFWMLRGLYSEARRWLTALVELDSACTTSRDGQPSNAARHEGAVAAEDRAHAVSALGTFASRQGDYHETRLRKEQSAAIWREMGDDIELVGTLADLGQTAWLLGNASEGIRYLEEARAVLERSDSGPLTDAYTSMTLRILGTILRSQGSYIDAAEYFRVSIDKGRVAIATGGYNVARGLCHLGRAMFLQGTIPQATEYFREALHVMQTERLAGMTLADCLDWIAAIADASGKTRNAAVLFGAADTQWHASGGVRDAPEQPLYETELARVQANLPADEFAAAWAEGCALSREQAVNCALEQLRTPAQ
jgi:non-specific serine/threonine protein kinase